MLSKELCKCLRLSLVAMAMFVFVFHSNVISAYHLKKVYIVSKSSYNDTTCVDTDGNIRVDGEEWMETVDGNTCNRRVCLAKNTSMFGILRGFYFKIHHDCPPEINVDPDNCVFVTSDNETFPACCRELNCTVGVIPNITYPDCYDRSSAFACEYWKNRTNCTSDPFGDYEINYHYNLTVGNCNETCGLCP